MTQVLIAGLLPCVVLMFYIYKKDAIEKEPAGLLVKLLVFGALSTIPAIVLELVGGNILTGLGFSTSSMVYYIVENFLVIGVAEEFSKRFMLRLGSWNDPNFNYIFDGVVYGVFVSLGFAGLENIGYIAGFGMEVAVIRGLAAIPLHAICGVFMGHFYGLWKANEKHGYYAAARKAKTLSLVIPVLIHGFYDFCASVDSDVLTYAWLIFVILMDVVAIRMIKQYAAEDQGF